MRLIDADSFIKWVQQCGARCPTVSVEKVFNKIKDAQIIELKKGKWIKKEFPLPLSDGSKVAYQCSCCKTHWDYESNYCPYCGAQMEGSDNG